MKKNNLNSTPKIIHKFFNLLLMLFNVLLALALYSILDLSRRWYIGVDPETSTFTGPALANFFLKKELIIIPILIVIIMVGKEFFIISFKNEYKLICLFYSLSSHMLRSQGLCRSFSHLFSLAKIIMGYTKPTLFVKR